MEGPGVIEVLGEIRVAWGGLMGGGFVLLLRFVRFLKDQLNTMLLQDCEKENKTLDRTQPMSFILII